jgi:hypothetical protein
LPTPEERKDAIAASDKPWATVLDFVGMAVVAPYQSRERARHLHVDRAGVLVALALPELGALHRFHPVDLHLLGDGAHGLVE